MHVSIRHEIQILEHGGEAFMGIRKSEGEVEEAICDSVSATLHHEASIQIEEFIDTWK